MSANTIDLSQIPSCIDQELVDLPWTYQDGEVFRKIRDERYKKFIKESDSLFQDWLRQTNKDILDNIDKFIKDSLASKTKEFFADAPSTINIATVVLGMQTSEHTPTIDMIEKQIVGKHNKMKVIRLRSESDLDKKTGLVNLFDQSGYQPNTFVIVERIETFKPHLLEALILILSDALRNKKIVTAMIMICMSGSWKNMSQTLPPEVMNRVGKLVQLVKDPRETIESMILELLKCGDEGFRLGPDLFELIDQDFFERDCSLANLKFLYQYSVLEHFTRMESIFGADKKMLKKEFKSDIPAGIFSKLNSIKKNAVKRPVNVIDYCSTSCKTIERSHEFVYNQVTYYFIILRDEARRNFPCHIQDIYLESTKYNDLGESSLMYDAIERLKHSPPSRVLNRIELATENYLEIEDVDDRLDVYTILTTYKDKLELEEDKLDVVSKLIEKLHFHVSKVKNPMKLPLSEAIYFNDVALIKNRVIPSDRQEALVDFTNESHFFGILYRMIHGSTETISLADLFEDFRAKLKIDKDGLDKAVFLDLIDSMEHQGLIKSESRSTRRDSIKRVVWL